MAGSMSSSYEDGAEEIMSGINITPLVDVTLVLLIMFMITVPAIVGSSPIDVNLPSTSSVSASDAQIPLVLSIKPNDRGEVVIFLNEKQTTVEELPKLLTELGPSGQQVVSLAADQSIPYGQVVQVMDRLHAQGLHRLALDTRHTTTKRP